MTGRGFLIDKALSVNGILCGGSSMDGVVTLVLASTKEIMKAQRELHSRGIAMRIVPLPDEISHDCGVVIQAREGDVSTITEILTGAALSEFKIYKKEQGEFICL